MTLSANLLNIVSKALFSALATVMCTFILVASESPERIHSQMGEGERFTLTNSVKPALATAKDQGAVGDSLVLPMVTIRFTKSAAQQADLSKLLQLQQNRHSSQFHKWLTPEQYADRFGLNGKDMERVSIWLQQQGFENIQAGRSRSFVTFRGTAAQAQAAFNTSIHNYLTPTGRLHYANATNPQLPKQLSGLVESIHGLHDFAPKPHSRPRLTSSVTGNHFLVPDDWATIYDVKALYNSGFDGTGRSIVIAGQSDIIMADIENFQTNIGLPVKDPQVIEVNSPGPGLQVTNGDMGESDLDLEWAGGIAKGASIIFVTANNVSDAENYAIDNNVADVLSLTYGDCEQDYTATEMMSVNSLFQQASVLGMTVTAASGDQGAADCEATATNSMPTIATNGLAVDVPASSPWVTGIGGTEFSDGSATGGTTYWNSTSNSNGGSALSYIPEMAWNDTTLVASLSGSGGGASKLNAKPTWQTGNGVPADGARDVPDVSFTSSPNQDGYLTCTETGTDTNHTPTCVVGLRVSAAGTFNVEGGTSAASPSFGGVVAILDQKLGGRQGLLNPNLYTLASIATNSESAFHDVTTGNNIVPCRAASPNCTTAAGATSGTLGFSAGAGYDQATGLGSVDAFNLVSQWNDDYKLAPSPATLTVNPGSSGTTAITVSPVGTFTGNVTFSCAVSSNIPSTTCAIPGTVSNGSGSVTLTISAASNATTPWSRHFPALPGLPGNHNLLIYALLAIFIATATTSLLRKQRRLPIAAFCLSTFLVVGLSSCGGGSSTTTTLAGSVATPTPAPAIVGTVTVTATSGSLVNSITIPLTIS